MCRIDSIPMDNVDRATTTSTILNPNLTPNVHLSRAIMEKTSTKALHLIIVNELAFGERFTRMARVEEKDSILTISCMFAG